MRVMAIIGDPIEQVKSPVTFGEYFRNRGINAVLIPLHVHETDFDLVLAGLRAIRNFSGTIVTIPHKQRAFELANTRGVMAAAAGAANVLVPDDSGGWTAELFDGIGLISALKTRKIDITGMKVLLLGAGGAGTAIGVALEKLGRVDSISVFDPDTKRAEQLLVRLKSGSPGVPDPAGYQLVINASPVGMRSSDMVFDGFRCEPGTIVCDAVMEPPTTRFLQRAEENGCTIVTGLEMLHGQMEPLAAFMGVADTTPNITG